MTSAMSSLLTRPVTTSGDSAPASRCFCSSFRSAGQSRTPGIGPATTYSGWAQCREDHGRAPHPDYDSLRSWASGRSMRACPLFHMTSGLLVLLDWRDPLSHLVLLNFYYAWLVPSLIKAADASFLVGEFFSKRRSFSALHIKFSLLHRQRDFLLCLCF